MDFKHFFQANRGTSRRYCFTKIQMTSGIHFYQIYENNMPTIPFIHFAVEIEELVTFSNTFKTEGTKIEYGRKLSTRG